MQNNIESPQPLQAVTFDLDGLMFNTEQLYQEVDREILARRGKNFPDALCDRMMGRKSSVAIQIMIDWHQLEDTTEQLAEEIAAQFAQVLPQRLAPMPGLLDLLDAMEGFHSQGDCHQQWTLICRTGAGPIFAGVSF